MDSPLDCLDFSGASLDPQKYLNGIYHWDRTRSLFQPLAVDPYEAERLRKFARTQDLDTHVARTALDLLDAVTTPKGDVQSVAKDQEATPDYESEQVVN